jgi:hypothetical protein
MRSPAICASALFAALTVTCAIADADEAFSVVINGRTGAAVLRNDGPSAVNLDGYLLRSPFADVFNPSSWNSLEDSATTGWSESLATGNRFGEANLFGATTVPAGGTLNIGSPYVPFAPSAFGAPEPGLGSINLMYSVADGGASVGDVEFISRNTVVLVVDPTTGEASLENQSAFNIEIDSYLIRSKPSVLDVEGWTPLEVGLGAGGGWTASTGTTNRIAEGNLFGATFLAANGGTLSLGTPIDPSLLDDETDLELEFTVVGRSALEGGVLFAAAAAPALAGDYNGNGTVDAADYALWRNGGPLQNEGVTPGNVTAEDYSFWRARFGMTAGSGSFVSATAVAVPEPASAGLFFAPWIPAAAIRTMRRKRQVYSG